MKFGGMGRDFGHLGSLGRALGPGIRLSSASFPAGSAQGTAIGTLSVAGGTGTYTFTLTDSASSKVQVAGTNGVNLQAGSASASASSFNVTVHADNGAGSTFDRTFSIVAWSSVSNTVAPAITGSAVQGVTLSVSNGTWSGYPSPSFTYQWKRAGSPIAGATSSTYGLQAADVGSAITCTVTASNGFSSANATSAATASVTKTTLSYTPVTSATQGSAYTGATPSASGGTAPYTYSVSGSLPAGLSLNSSTGVISGTPTTVQTASGLVLVVTDANGVMDSGSAFSIDVASSSIPTAFTLTDIASGRLFQRTKALTTGPVSASGTYTGGSPSAVELQVRKVSDNSIVKAWTTASATIAGGNWSATITGVAQGGSYYVEARPSNATGLAKTGSNPFYIGILIVMYGQSNMLGMTGTTSSPPSATAGTTYFNGSAWIAVPAGNGVRELLNGVIAATSIPCAALNGAVAGVPISSLSKGQTNYTNIAAQITAAGGDFEFIAWHQGEGDSANGTSQSTYLAALSQLHSDLVTDYGRTKAQAPLVLAGLGTVTGGASGYGTDATWDAMERTLIDASTTNASTTYSHSNRDAVIINANVHYDGAGYGNAGKRYARSMTTLLGSTSGYPNWHIASAAVVDATHTTVDLTHGLGTDFTPTSGITGFEVSGDNGANWAAPSAAVRTNATRITLTHSSLATDSNRKLRYQYGLLPDTSGIVLDNSSLAVPLDNSAGVISPTPLSTLPVPTFRTNVTMSTGVNTANVSQAGMNIVNAAADLLLIAGVSVASATQTLSSATITPNGGSPISATVVKTDTSNTHCSIIQFAIPNGTDLTNATFAVVFTGSVFNAPRCAFWTVPQADLSSTTAVDKQTATSASANALTISNLTTSLGGFVIAISNQATISANSNTWSGAESYAERYDVLAGSRYHTGADASGTAASSGASSVTSTWTGAAAAMRVTAASWR